MEVMYTYIPKKMENDHFHAFTNMDFKKGILISVIINFTHILGVGGITYNSKLLCIILCLCYAHVMLFIHS